MIFHGGSNSVCVSETRDSGDLLELPEPQVTGCAIEMIMVFTS